MEIIKSHEMMMSGSLGTEAEVKIEIKEEFCAAIGRINSQETATSDIQPTMLPERSSQLSEVILPSTQVMHSPPRCRLCATQGINMVDLLGPNEIDKNILEKIENCLPIVVRETDPLPKQACRLCLANLELCYQFTKTVAQAERQLLALERLASSGIEETRINCETFEPYDEQHGPMEHDDLEGSLITTSDVKAVPAGIETKDSTSNLEKDNRPSSSSNNVYQNSESSMNLSNSCQISAPQTTQQSTHDSLMFPRMSNRLLAHKEMISNSCHGRKFVHKENVALHDRIQVNKRPYSCKWCAKTFRSKSGQNNHIRTHTGVGLHSCEYCHKKFSLRTNRDYHHRLHTGERPYKCSICHKTFAWVTSLYQHASVHSRERNFHCSVCNKSFKLLPARDRHMASHTGAYP